MKACITASFYRSISSYLAVYATKFIVLSTFLLDIILFKFPLKKKNAITGKTCICRVQHILISSCLFNSQFVYMDKKGMS